MDTQQNDFSKGSIPRAILRMAVPMTVAQAINIMYNIVDRIYIGHISDGVLALTGIGITLPIITILIGFANLWGTGGAPLCAMARGRGDKKDAEHIMGNAFVMLLIQGVVLTAVGLILKRPILYAFGADDSYYKYADQFMTIYLLGTPMVMISLGMNPFINAQGFSKMGMMTVALGAVINIFLDPLFIFVFNMGVRGAAIANVISQTCSAIWVLSFLTGNKAILRLHLKDLYLKASTVGRILSLGISGFCMNLTTSLVQIVCNKVLLVFGGDLYVSVMTVVNAIRDVASLGMQGITMGGVPVLSYNYGAQKYERIRQGIRFSTVAGLIAAAVPWLFIMLFPSLFIRVFNSDPDLIRTGVPAFHIYFSSFVFMTFQMVGQTVSQALGRAKSAIFFSLLRKAFIVAPLTVILPHLWNLGTNGVFWAEPISNVVGGLACWITMIFIAYIPLGRLEKAQQVSFLENQ
ncbi:putative efflux protein, MATE family [Sporobacter termitidis DSM 10068]|uniref:Multidrug export protein MepA n=1 Tax=Sporobacter termitidis DSM 10068 TaxID=1123282 RepID=A0A1M5Y8V4_9FIRM|nr:MATE family efflux transporter [Sporobacter termitidis]SHI08412.1 putative efflux protein, MATE family [Sporobacter termitidis DSM 10068]